MSEELLNRILEELQGVKGEVSGVKGEVSGLKQHIEMNMATKEDIAELPYMSRAILEINERTTRMEESMVTKVDIEYVDKKLMEHDRDIFKIKQRIGLSRVEA